MKLVKFYGNWSYYTTEERKVVWINPKYIQYIRPVADAGGVAIGVSPNKTFYVFDSWDSFCGKYHFLTNC